MKKILAPTDFSIPAEAALEMAIMIAKEAKHGNISRFVSGLEPSFDLSYFSTTNQSNACPC